MLCNVKIRIKTPVVGNTWDHKRQMFIFPRDEGAWALDIASKHVWGGLLANAVESLGLEVDVDTVRWPSSLLLPKLHLLTVFPSPEKKQRPVNHESIPKNVVLTIPIMLRQTDGENQLAVPTIKELYAIFNFIGAYEGISPFGSASGYGLFTTQSIHPLGRTPLDASELSEGSAEGVYLPNQGDPNGQPGKTEERPQN